MSLYNNLSFLPLIPMVIFFSQTIRRNSIIMLLLFLECYILSLTLFLFFSMSTFSPWLLVLLLLFAACEAAIGLALLVAVVRRSGAASVNSLISLKC